MTLGSLRRRLVGVYTGAMVERVRDWMPPVERRAFWAVQVLVVLVAFLHSGIEYLHLLADGSPLYLLPTTLYLIPVMYAAVSFGLRGALLTALWSAILVTINLVLWHEGLERVGELLQVAWIGVAGLFVGYRVDRERAARKEAEAREAARYASERRHRDIVDNVVEAIVILDDTGRIIEVNRAAADLLGHEAKNLRGRPIPPVADARIAEVLAGQTSPPRDVPSLTLGEPPRRFELVATPALDSLGQRDIQLLFRDITARYEREQGLEVIARDALAAREAEQQRIARELHDGPLQSVVQLWRDLDALAEETPQARRAPVDAARASAEGVARDLRRFSRDLRPSVLDDLGISAAIRAEAESLRHRAGMSVRVGVEGHAKRLEEDTELALLRITQEAVRNTEQHSGASDVSIQLTFGDGVVELVIADDGGGFDHTLTSSELLAKNHLGIVGMRERARLVGGHVDLSTTPGGGLTVAVALPTYELPHR